MRLLPALRCVLRCCLFHVVASELQCVDALQEPTRDRGATVQVFNTHQRDSWVSRKGPGLGWVFVTATTAVTAAVAYSTSG